MDWKRHFLVGLAASFALGCGSARNGEPLVLDLDLEQDSLNVSHAIPGFFFPPTQNRSPFSDRDLNAAFAGEELRNALAATVLVRRDGALVGFATEQELVTPPSAGKPVAASAWLITLTRPGLTGVIAVTQQEDASGVFALAQRVAQSPDEPWEDRPQRFLSTSAPAHVGIATGDLASYQGGRFEEYDLLNPADWKRLGRFRGAIQFVIRAP